MANDLLKQPVQNLQSVYRKKVKIFLSLAQSMFSKTIFAAAESLSVIESVSMVTGVA